MSENEPVQAVAGQTGQSECGHKNMSLVFMKESAVFGDRRPAQSEW